MTKEEIKKLLTAEANAAMEVALVLLPSVISEDVKSDDLTNTYWKQLTFRHVERAFMLATEYVEYCRGWVDEYVDSEIEHYEIEEHGRPTETSDDEN